MPALSPTQDRLHDHPGWAEAIAGIDTPDSRDFIRQRAEAMDLRTLIVLVHGEGVTVDAWKREIYAAELAKRTA
jgi:hypothetical protein